MRKLLARLLAASRRLADMAGWDETVCQPEVAAALRELAVSGLGPAATCTGTGQESEGVRP